MNSFSISLNKIKQNELEATLKENNFNFFPLKYGRFQGKSDHYNLSVNLYNSGKLLLQGRDVNKFMVNFPSFFKGIHTTQKKTLNESTYEIGMDESGKGDFLGPLVVSAIYVPKEEHSKLSSIGVMDSKKLTDNKISKISSELKAKYSFSTEIITPEKYNNDIKNFKNLNHLLSWWHIKNLKSLSLKMSSPRMALLDQFFVNESVILPYLKEFSIHRKNIDWASKAEENPVVAAASIIARDTFVKELHRMEGTLKISISKGAGPKADSSARKALEKVGEDKLHLIVKTNFKNMNRLFI